MADKRFPPVLEQGSSLPDMSGLAESPPDPLHVVLTHACSDFFTCFDLLPLSVFEEVGGFAPGITVVHSPGAVMVFADLPGMAADEIEIVFLPGQLVISVEKSPVSKRGVPLFESFRRKVAIPFPVDHHEIRAILRKGALLVFLPEQRGTAARKTRIPIDIA